MPKVAENREIYYINRHGKTVQVECPKCHAKQGQIFIGKNKSGTHRAKCKQCGKKYTLEAKKFAYSLATQSDAIVRYLAGSENVSLRVLAKQTGVKSHQTIANWRTKYLANTSQFEWVSPMLRRNRQRIFRYVDRQKAVQQERLRKKKRL